MSKFSTIKLDTKKFEVSWYPTRMHSKTYSFRTPEEARDFALTKLQSLHYRGRGKLIQDGKLK